MSPYIYKMIQLFLFFFWTTINDTVMISINTCNVTQESNMKIIEVSIYTCECTLYPQYTNILLLMQEGSKRPYKHGYRENKNSTRCVPTLTLASNPHARGCRSFALQRVLYVITYGKLQNKGKKVHAYIWLGLHL